MTKSNFMPIIPIYCRMECRLQSKCEIYFLRQTAISKYSKKQLYLIIQEFQNFYKSASGGQQTGLLLL